MTGDVLILGCGYVGERLAVRLRGEGVTAIGTTRDPGKARRLEAAGVRTVRLDVRAPGWEAKLAALSPGLVYYLIPPVPGEVAEGGLAADGAASTEPAPARALRVLARGGLRGFVYGSTTGTYGDRGGDWVDESSDPRPDSARGAARLAAERAVLAAGSGAGVRACVVRIAGIYGPGRLLSRGRRLGYVEVLSDAQTWSNRIHVEDLVEALLLVGRRGEGGETYNACDDRPHRTADFLRLGASLLGLEVRQVTTEAVRRDRSASRAARRLASRRISNRKLRELGLVLRHPDYRTGLPAALAAERGG